jgi:CHAD domain-containing protein
VEERERKLTIQSGEPLSDPATLFEGLGQWTDETVEQVATYFDTADLRLTRAGVSLRYRSDDGWTVKTPIVTADDELRRREHTFAGQLDARPAPAEELVLGWSRTAELEPIARVTTQRRRLRLAAGTVPLAEVADDRVEAEGAGEEPISFREIEIELADGADPKLLRTLSRRLREAGAHPATDGQRPKVARALGARALDAADVTDPGRVARDATLGQLVRHAIATSVARLVEHDHLVRLDEDPEGVHQARVATRRLRSDLHTFTPVLDPTWVDDLRTDLQWLGAALGRVRDADVLLERLDERARRLPETDRAGLAALADQLRATRRHDRTALLDAMASPRYLTLLDRLVAAAATPRFAGDDADRPARRRAPRLARRSWKKLRRTIRALSDDPSDEQLHEVRKRAKHARYALEAIAPVSDGDVRRLAARVSDLQDVLGEHHDDVGAVGWLRGAAETSGTVAAAFTAGELAGAFGADATARRAGWRPVWKRARTRATRVF